MNQIERQVEKYDNVLCGINHAKYRLIDSKLEIFTKDDICRELDEISKWHYDELQRLIVKLHEVGVEG